MSGPPPASGAPRWLWVTTLVATGVATAMGARAASLFVAPPSVEEEPGGLVFVGAFFVLALAVPAFVSFLVALARRRRPSAVLWLAVSLCASLALVVPLVTAALPGGIDGTVADGGTAPDPDGRGPAAVQVFDVAPDGLLVRRERRTGTTASELERVDTAVNELIGSAPPRGRRSFWSPPCSTTYTGLVTVGEDLVTVDLLGPAPPRTPACRLTAQESAARRQQLAWTVQANLERPRGMRVRGLQQRTWTDLRAEPAFVGGR